MSFDTGRGDMTGARRSITIFDFREAAGAADLVVSDAIWSVACPISFSEHESAVLVLVVRALCSIVFPIELFFFENEEIVSGRLALLTDMSAMKRFLDAALPCLGDGIISGGANGIKSSLSIGAFIQFDVLDD